MHKDTKVQGSQKEKDFFASSLGDKFSSFIFYLQAKYNALQRRHEQAEMDLMQARLVATAIENELDEDDADGEFTVLFSVTNPSPQSSPKSTFCVFTSAIALLRLIDRIVASEHKHDQQQL